MLRRAWYCYGNFPSVGDVEVLSSYRLEFFEISHLINNDCWCVCRPQHNRSTPKEHSKNFGCNRSGVDSMHAASCSLFIFSHSYPLLCIVAIWYENESSMWNVNNSQRVVRCRQKHAASCPCDSPYNWFAFSSYTVINILVISNHYGLVASYVIEQWTLQ